MKLANVELRPQGLSRLRAEVEDLQRTGIVGPQLGRNCGHPIHHVLGALLGEVP